MPASECGLPVSTDGLVDEFGQWTVPSYKNEPETIGGAGKRAAVRAIPDSYSGPAGAGGPVVTGTRFRAVTDVAEASGPSMTGTGGPVVTGTGFRAVTEVAGASRPEAVRGRSRNAVPGSR